MKTSNYKSFLTNLENHVKVNYPKLSTSLKDDSIIVFNPSSIYSYSISFDYDSYDYITVNGFGINLTDKIDNFDFSVNSIMYRGNTFAYMNYNLDFIFRIMSNGN